jgi:cell division protein FtsQ
MPRVTRRPGGPTGDRPSALRLLLRRGWKLVRPVRWVVFGCVVLVGGAVALHLLLPPGSGSQSGTGAASGGSLTTFRERIGNATASLGLRVETIVIEGRANTPEPLLRAALGISKGDPILGFSLDAARRNVEKLSWVEQATIERRLPDTVVVQLVERRPFAIWQNQGKFVLIDRDGQTVTNEDVGQFRQLPLVVGPGAPGAATPLIDALMAHPGLLARVVAAVRVGERRWNLQLRGGMNVMLPESREAVAIERLVVLQQDHALLDRPLEVVDMRLPDRLVLRPRAEPAADAAAKKPT